MLELNSTSHSCLFSRLGQAEEAQEQYQSCVADAGVRKMDLANAKSTILTQIRKMVFQCDLTLKAVSCEPTQAVSIQGAPVGFSNTWLVK